ncbi:MAG: hypothetical protein ACNA7W_03545 [Pseudomonadales bacterium]
MAVLARRRDAAIKLTEFPLIRAALVRTDPSTHYFIGVVAHIISDGFGALSIIKAVSIAYVTAAAAGSGGRAVPGGPGARQRLSRPAGPHQSGSWTA